MSIFTSLFVLLFQLVLLDELAWALRPHEDGALVVLTYPAIKPKLKTCLYFHEAETHIIADQVCWTPKNDHSEVFLWKGWQNFQGHYLVASLEIKGRIYWAYPYWGVDNGEIRSKPR